jgi:Fic family protein
VAPEPRGGSDAIWEGIWYEEAHHSTAIEGNTLVLKEVERLLREGKAVGSKELAEYLEVEGYAKAAQWVYAQAVEQPPEWSVGERINLTELRQIHRLVGRAGLAAFAAGGPARAAMETGEWAGWRRTSCWSGTDFRRRSSTSAIARGT